MHCFSLGNLRILQKLPVDNFGTHLKNKNTRILANRNFNLANNCYWALNKVEEKYWVSNVTITQHGEMPPSPYGNFL